MWSALDLSILMITIITGISGTITYSSVFIVYFRHWKETNNPGVCDKIQFVTVLTNAFLQGIMIVNTIFFIFGIYLIVGKKLLLFIFMLEGFLFDVCFWNTTWISIFYSLRLVKISHKFFLNFKTRFTSSVPQLITGSLLCSIVINIPMLWTTSVDIYKNNTNNPTQQDHVITWDYVYAITSSVIRFCLPFPTTCLCIGLSVTTVLRHIWRMKTESHVASPQLQGHVRAVRAMFARVMTDIVFNFLATVFDSLSFCLNNILLTTLFLFIQLYPMTQTLIIIYGNPRFKSRLCGHSITT